MPPPLAIPKTKPTTQTPNISLEVIGKSFLWTQYDVSKSQ
jgi:hypothetical protein